MIIVDAECLTCGKRIEVDLLATGGTECPIMVKCACSGKVVEHKRLWSAPHTGGMSNGEPPR